MKTLSILFIILLIAAFGNGCSKKEETVDANPQKRLRDAMISYMSEPMFRNRDFVQQITGTEADLKLYDLDEETLYFVINKTDFDSSSTLDKLTIDKRNVNFGNEQNGDVYLGAYTFKGTSKFLFRFPRNDLKPDSTRSITINFPGSGITYTVNMNELADYAESKSVYGGNTSSEIRANKYMANHGAFISVKDEPSLMRLCGKIITDKTNKEKTAQELLDFVTANIKFSQNEASGGYEIMKRPNEVLMTGISDCSGLTILYASLLEQTGINYRLVYFPGHIGVAIEGSFPNRNGIKIKYDGIDYSYAETTASGFRIGITELLNKDITTELKFIQKPGKGSKIIDVKTGSAIGMN